jgi:hypothetical protein
VESSRAIISPQMAFSGHHLYVWYASWYFKSNSQRCSIWIIVKDAQYKIYIWPEPPMLGLLNTKNPMRFGIDGMELCTEWMYYSYGNDERSMHSVLEQNTSHGIWMRQGKLQYYFEQCFQDSDFCHDDIDTLILPLKIECIWIQLFNIYSVIMKAINDSDGLHNKDLEATALE